MIERCNTNKREFRYQPLSQIIREVASNHGCDAEALRSAVRRHADCPSRVHSLRILSDDQEHVICATLLSQASLKKSLRAVDLRNLVNSAFSVDVTMNWVQSFMGRHKDLLRYCKARIVAKARVKQNIRPDTIRFCELYGCIIDNCEIVPHALINIDECRLAMRRDGQLGLTTICGVDEIDQNVQAPTDGLTMSVLPFVSAAGECLAVFIVLKAPGKIAEGKEYALDIIHPSKHFRRSARLSKHPWSYFYVYTKSGYINTQCYDAIMQRFTAIWHTRYPGLDCWVLADQLGCHKDPKVVESLAEDHIYTLLFPPNTSHFLQPLDGHVFRTLKRAFGPAAAAARLDAALTDGDSRHIVFYALYDAARAAFRPGPICKSFSDRGVWPFKPDVIELHLDAWIGRCSKAMADQQLSERRLIVHSLMGKATSQAAARTEKRAASSTVVEFRAGLHTPMSYGEILDAADATTKAKQRQEEERVQKRVESGKRKREQEKEKARKKRQRMLDTAARNRARLIIKKCRGGCRKLRGNKKWPTCPCGQYVLCYDCAEIPARRRAFEAHEAICVGDRS